MQKKETILTGLVVLLLIVSIFAGLAIWKQNQAAPSGDDDLTPNEMETQHPPLPLPRSVDVTATLPAAMNARSLQEISRNKGYKPGRFYATTSDQPEVDPCSKPNPNQKEICGDGIDNNCNGVADEGCNCEEEVRSSCRPHDVKCVVSRSCGRNVGECSFGIQSCISDGRGGHVWSNTCVGAKHLSREVCDGLDNDCNGIIDDGNKCP